LDELEKIYKADLSKHPQRREMERVRVLTILGCSTGLRHSDWVKVKKELVHEEDGELLLNVFAKKTKAKIGIPFTPMLRTLLDENDWQIPRMAVQRYNEGIKSLCKYVGIERSVLVMKSVGGKPTSDQVPFYEVVSSHACRRTFISTMLLLGVPASQILPITGHQTEKQMRAYAAIENRQNAASVSKQFKQGMINFLGITNEKKPKLPL
jgi:integrase